MVYYVQVTSAWEGDRWRTIYATEDSELAEWVEKMMEIGENHFGMGNPGLTKMRKTRTVEEEELFDSDGSAAVREAENDLQHGWSDPPTHYARADLVTGERRKIPVDSLVYINCAAERDYLLRKWDERHPDKEIEFGIEPTIERTFFTQARTTFRGSMQIVWVLYQAISDVLKVLEEEGLSADEKVLRIKQIINNLETSDSLETR